MTDVIYSIGVKLGGGGLGNTSRRAIMALQRNGLLKKAICIGYKGNVEIDSRLINVVKIPSLIYRSFIARDNFFDFSASFLIDPCDIFHTWANYGLFQLRKAKKYHAKTFVERGSTHILEQYRLLEEERKKFGIGKSIHPLVIRKMLQEYKETDHILVPSSFAYESFKKHGGAEKVIVIPRAVDVEKFKPVRKKDEVFRILFVGFVNLRKGIPYLLEAWSQLDLKNAELTLIGHKQPGISPLLNFYQRKKPFKHYEWVKHSDIVKYYQEADVFCLPSIEEGSALVTYEAMAAGLPLVVTRNSGSVAIDGKHGFIIPARDVDALKEKITYFYENEDEGRRMGMAARRYVSKYYRWENYQERLIETYRKILESS